MQKKMYRCGEQWFPNYDEIRPVLAKAGYYPPSEAGLDVLAQIEAGEYRPLPPSPDLPSEFSLQDKMPPIYDQSGRGTCVAQAATALIEYYYDCKWRFSMQYLFERIKRLEKEKLDKAVMEIVNGKLLSDPKMAKVATSIAETLNQNDQDATPENIAYILSKKKVTLSAGSNGSMAMEVLAKWGICTYEKWPYSRQLIDTTADVDAARPNMPPGADEEAAFHRLVAPYYEFPSPNNVEEIKRYIAGADGNRPMPVMIGAFTLNNLTTDGDCVRMPKLKKWKVESALCELTPVSAQEGGFTYKMTSFDENSLEEEDSIVAMDMHITGGHEMLLVGYQDDEAFAGGGYFIVRNSWDEKWGQEGYCKMPYAYVELFVDEACTIVEPMKFYTGSANGTGTYATPGIPDDLKEYVVKADSEQKDRAGRWTIAKGMLIIVDKAGLVDRYTEQNAMLFRRQGFSWAPKAEGEPVHKNSETEAAASPRLVLSSMEEQFFSGIEAAFGRKPLQFPQLGGLRKGWFSGTGEMEAFECSSDLSERLGDPLKIYKASGKNASFRIAALYIKNAANAGDAVGKARTLVKEFAAQHPFEPCVCTIYVIGCNAPIATVVQPFVSESDVRIVLDNYTAEEGWRVNAASQANDDALNEWLLRLAPNTPLQWSALLQRAYQNVEAIGGHVTLAKMAKETGTAGELVAAAIAKFMPSLQVKGEQVTKR